MQRLGFFEGYHRERVVSLTDWHAMTTVPSHDSKRLEIALSGG